MADPDPHEMPKFKLKKGVDPEDLDVEVETISIPSKPMVIPKGLIKPLPSLKKLDDGKKNTKFLANP